MSKGYLLLKQRKQRVYYAVAFGLPGARNPRFLALDGRLALFSDQLKAAKTANAHSLKETHMCAITEVDRGQAIKLAGYLNAKKDEFLLDGFTPVHVDEIFSQSVIVDGSNLKSEPGDIQPEG